MADNNNNSLTDNKQLRLAIIAAVISLVVAPIAASLAGLEWAVIVMVEIAVVSFFIVLFVMIIGSVEDHYPTTAADSPSVLAWSERLGAAEQAKVEETVDTIEEASGDSDA